MQNNRREIKPPEEPMREKTEFNHHPETKEGVEECHEDDDDGNWKRRRNIKTNDNSREEVEDGT